VLAIPNVPVHLPPTVPAAVSTDHHPEQRDEHPLLTPPEQRRSRQSLQSLRAGSSLAVELDSSGERSELATVPLPQGRKGKGRATDYTSPAEPDPSDAIREGRVDIVVMHDNMPRRDQELVSPFPITSKDVEGAPGDHRIRRTPSKVSIPGTLQTATHNQPQDQGGDFDEEDQFAWGPSHPCFPHLNPHVPLSSPLYSTTRIIRIRRDWMQMGDLAPLFASVYPEVLDEPRVMSEDEFRRVIKHVNNELVAAFSPWSLRSVFDAIVGVATAWLWEDLGFTGVKSRLRRLEDWIESWNREVGARDGVRIIPLQRTAYMTVSLPDRLQPYRAGLGTDV
jgi:hypothetical protein